MDQMVEEVKNQIMLFSYSLGSVAGPIIADGFILREQGLMGYLFTCLLATSIYMLIASIKLKSKAKGVYG